MGKILVYKTPASNCSALSRYFSVLDHHSSVLDWVLTCLMPVLTCPRPALFYSHSPEGLKLCLDFLGQRLLKTLLPRQSHDTPTICCYDNLLMRGGPKPSTIHRHHALTKHLDFIEAYVWRDKEIQCRSNSMCTSYTYTIFHSTYPLN